MELKSKNGIWGMIVKDVISITKRHEEISKRLEENTADQKEYLRALFNQLLQPSSVPVVTKTPKISRKRGFQCIETIPEDEVLDQENVEDTIEAIPEKEKYFDNKAEGRTKRIASLKAVDNIAKQTLLMHNTRLGKLSNNENTSFSVKKGKRESQLKRKKSAQNSSDEDENKAPSKYSKLEVNEENKGEPGRKTRKMTEQTVQSNEEKIEKIKERDTSQKLPSFSKSKSKECQEKEVKKDNDAIISPTTDIVEESIYEDAIGKPTPIMNSTLKYSSVVTDKILNVTVVLEPLPPKKILNETVVIQKGPSQWSSRENSKERTSLKKAQGSTQLTEKTVEQNILYNGLITDDESSPELKKSKKQIAKKQKRHVLSASEDDEVPNTPVKNVKENFKNLITPLVKQEIKNIHKSNALFSPYAKESVKKRVEAFEQAVMQSPKSVDMNEPTRITRTKTRAMAAAEAEAEVKNTDKNYTQILARKSLAKAKKIAYFVEKQKKDNEESKENKEQMPERINKLTKYDRLNAMPQFKTTPLNKLKIVAPMSATRLQTPSNTQNLVNYGKTLTASRANIVTTMESFIQVPKTSSKNNSADKLEDKKRPEEDAMKKRKEALRLQTEEKRRKREEKELKNKLAREAKEKQELEKRQKAEKEREEKAKLAQLMQEKQREEMEKKRLAQLQRAQEKEERRKLEEHQRLQKLLEQEEAERLLAEQKRREQEAERRKEMEVRAQQQAEAMRLKNIQMTQVKHKQAGNKQQGATNYVLDSEPDDDDSDDESKPKHEIPYWAQAHVRKVQLAMQRHIPTEIVYRFFDTRKCTPDLTELFQGIDRNRLKRTSSAIWKTPPRFSMMEGE